MRTDINNIKVGIERACSRHPERKQAELMKRKPLRKSTLAENNRRFTNLHITERQDILRSLSAEYATDVELLAQNCVTIHSTQEVRRLAASYAYFYTYEKRAEERRCVPSAAFKAVEIAPADTEMAIASHTKSRSVS